jgi:hypothetical protein
MQSGEKKAGAVVRVEKNVKIVTKDESFDVFGFKCFLCDS